MRARAVTGLLSLVSVLVAIQVAHAEKVAYRMKVAGKGADVRLYRVYRPGLAELGPGPVMPSPALVSQTNYDNIKTYVKAILTKFPPHQYYYVGVGRTGGPIIAMLKNLGPDVAINFPSSSINTDGQQAFAGHREHYREHIEALVPESVRKGDRKLLLIDYSSGSSLRGLQGVFEAYRAAGGSMPDMELLSVGYGAGVTGAHALYLDSQNTEQFWKDREEVAEFLGETGDKGHIIHSAGGGLDALSRNPKFAEHRRSLLQRMRRDQDLDDFLKAHFPGLVRAP